MELISADVEHLVILVEALISILPNIFFQKYFQMNNEENEKFVDARNETFFLEELFEH